MKALRLADDLEEVLAGRLSIEVVLDNHDYWPELDSCSHGLQHFAMDDDIRAKSPPYKKLQEDEMRYLIALLRSGASPDELSEVHFLGYSKKAGR